MAFQGVARLLTEWLDSNQNRAYPLDESTSGGNAVIPFPVFVDALFTVSGNIDTERLFISKVVLGDTSFKIYLGGYISNVFTDFGLAADIPYSLPAGSDVPVDIRSDSYMIVGGFVVGDVSKVRELQAVVDISQQSGLIFPGCVRSTDSWLTGIKVNDTIYTGVVTLVAGAGIEFDVNTTEEGTVLTITSKQQLLPSENTVITSDEELLNSAITQFGAPVRTICGVLPDDNGNINIVSIGMSGGSSEGGSSDEGGQISEIFAESVGGAGGAIRLAMTNDTTITTCTDNTDSAIELLTENLANLNDRAAKLDIAVSALDKSVSDLSLQISRY